MDRTRTRILRAARALLLAGNAGGFSLEAVARRARVTRATVYQRFGSRPRLLEAVFDDLARRGGMGDLADAFRQADPAEALARFVTTFGRFWTAHRPIHRRLAALGTLDPALGRSLAARQEWRRQGLRVIVGRLTGRMADEQTVTVLFALTSFPMFDLLAGARRTPAEAAPLVLELARRALAKPPV